MTITTTQKLIKIGTSKGVTIQAKLLRELQLEVGKSVKVTIEPVEKESDIRCEYETFKAKYSETLKNLSDR